MEYARHLPPHSVATSALLEGTLRIVGTLEEEEGDDESELARGGCRCHAVCDENEL